MTLGGKPAGGGPYIFSAVIYRQGILRAVDVPADVAAAFAGWDFPPVLVTVAGAERATTLVRRSDGGLRLFLHDRLRKAAPADTGDEVEVRLRLDDAPPAPWPDDVMHLAAGIEHGLQALELMPPGLRRQVFEFLTTARSGETRRKRLSRIRELLAQRAARLGDG